MQIVQFWGVNDRLCDPPSAEIGSAQALGRYGRRMQSGPLAPVRLSASASDYSIRCGVMALWFRAQLCG